MSVDLNGGIQKFLVFNCLFVGLISSCASNHKDKVSYFESDRADQADFGSNTTVRSSELVISAAASMQQVLEEISELYAQRYPQVKLVFNFGSSGSLQHQIEQGAAADLFISAAPQQMNQLADKQLLKSNTRQDLVENQMVLVAPSDRNTVGKFANLKDRTVEQIALGEPNSVPAGQYAHEILTSLQLADAVEPKAIYGKDARQVFNYVATGNVDAAIVYRTDALHAKQVAIVDVPPESAYSAVVYPVAVMRESKNILAAEQLLEFLFSAEAQAAFQRYGFLPAKQTH